MIRTGIDIIEISRVADKIEKNAFKYLQWKKIVILYICMCKILIFLKGIEKS